VSFFTLSFICLTLASLRGRRSCDACGVSKRKCGKTEADVKKKRKDRDDDEYDGKGKGKRRQAEPGLEKLEERFGRVEEQLGRIEVALGGLGRLEQVLKAVAVRLESVRTTVTELENSMGTRIDALAAAVKELETDDSDDGDDDQEDDKDGDKDKDGEQDGNKAGDIEMD